MELFIRKYLNGVEQDVKCSLWEDEKIELTKQWQQQQFIDGYGSYSNTFSVPVDSNNAEIFNYYNLIYGHYANSTTLYPQNQLDPKYVLKAKIIVNEFEIVGNIQVVGFTMKDDQYYSFTLNFFTFEKNLVWYLNKYQFDPSNTGVTITNRLNNIPITGLDFTFNKENVMATWEQDNPPVFVPLMATERELNFNQVQNKNNISSLPLAYEGGPQMFQIVSGITMNDLKPSYNLKLILEKLFGNFELTLEHSSGVTEFLDNLYIMPNPKKDDKAVNGTLTYIYLGANESNLVTYNNITLNVLTYIDTVVGNTDNISWSANTYTAASTGKYVFNLKVSSNFKVPQKGYSLFYVIDVDTNILIKSGIYNLSGEANIIVDLVAGQKVKFATDYQYYYFDINTHSFKLYRNYFRNKDAVKFYIKIEKQATNSYNTVVSKPNFPDMLVSDFWINLCKTFNIFFEYDEQLKIVKTYFKTELPIEFFDLTEYLLLDKVYTFNAELKYKKIDYKFKEATDINNVFYKKATGYDFGRYTEYFNYDVGKDMLEYTSIFTVFPKTTLNLTNSDNEILDDTNICLHSEINESYQPINTDFLLFYKKGILYSDYNYNIQNSENTFTNINSSADYSSDTDGTFSLDYNVFPEAIENNRNQRFEVTYEFLFPTDVLKNIDIYDIVVVRGIYYEIVQIKTDIETGYSVMMLKTVDLTYGDVVNIPPDPWEKSAVIPCGCYPPTITSVQYLTGTSVALYVTYSGSCDTAYYYWSKDLVNWNSGETFCSNVQIDLGSDLTGTTYFKVLVNCGTDCSFYSTIYVYDYTTPTTTTTTTASGTTTTTTAAPTTTTTTTAATTTTTTTTAHVCDLEYTIDSITDTGSVTTTTTTSPTTTTTTTAATTTTTTTISSCGLDYTIDSIETTPSVFYLYEGGSCPLFGPAIYLYSTVYIDATYFNLKYVKYGSTCYQFNYVGSSSSPFGVNITEYTIYNTCEECQA